MIQKNTKTISIAAIIIAAAILIYGFIDMQSYRSGYISGYSAMSRVVDAACMAGDVLDSGLCVRLENDLYADGGDGVYSATAIDAFGPSLVERVAMPLATVGTAETASPAAPAVTTPTKRSRRSRRSSAAEVPAPVVVAQEVVSIAPPPPPEPPKPLTVGEKAMGINCSSFTTTAMCGGDQNKEIEPYCKWYSGTCIETDYKKKYGGATQGLCASGSIKDVVPGAEELNDTSPISGDLVTVCFSRITGKFVYVNKKGERIGEPESMATLLSTGMTKFRDTAKGFKLTAAVAVPVVFTCAPPPAIPAPGCIPPANMAPPMPPQAAAPQNIFFASLIEIVRSFWYATK